MFKLVKNELYKLFHKKSTFITLFVLFVFVVITNLIYSNMEDLNYYYNDPSYLEELEKEVNAFDKEHGDMIKYASLLSSLEVQKYVQDKNNDWRVQFYYSKIAQYVEEYYNEKYVLKDENKAQELRNTIDTLVKKLDNGEWRYFAQAELKALQSNKKMQNNPEFVGDVTNQEIQNYKIKLLEYRLENDVSYEKSYLNSAIEALEYNIQDKINYEKATQEQDKKQYKDGYREFMKNEYILKEKEDINNEQSVRSIIINFFDEYLFLILVFVIMIAGAMVSDEFSKGTIKSLLTMPYKRSQILLAKFITVLLMIPFVTCFLLISQLLLGGILFGFSSLSIPVVEYNFKINAIETMSVMKYFLLSFLGNSPMLILLSTLAFALSTIVCSTSFAITITFCGFIGAAFINQLALAYKIEILNYFVTTNWNLTSFIFGGSSMYNIPFYQSIIVCLIYFIIMLVVAFIVFKKKNIKNI